MQEIKKFALREPLEDISIRFETNEIAPPIDPTHIIPISKISSSTVLVDMNCIVGKLGCNTNPFNAFLINLNKKRSQRADDIDMNSVKHIFKLQFDGDLSRIMMSIGNEVCSTLALYKVVKMMAALLSNLKINNVDLKQILEKTFEKSGLTSIRNIDN
jgi:hypothetical protein